MERMKKFVAVVVLLSLLSTGLSAPLSSCDSLVKPITISNEDMLGRWLYIGGSSDLPGSRSLGHLMTSVWLDITATTQSNILNLLQTQRMRQPMVWKSEAKLKCRKICILYWPSGGDSSGCKKKYGECSSLVYNVTFENSTLYIEQPFYLKEVYLKTDCSDCLVVHEEVVSGKDTFTSLLLFSRRQSVSPAVVEMFKTQAECLRMTPPIMIDTNYEICPDNILPSEGISALNSLLEAKMGHRVAKLLDALFDMFVN